MVNLQAAPVCLFVYNRLQHTQMAVESLLANAEVADTDLFVFSDAPRDDAAAEKVEQVRQYVKSISGFRRVVPVEQTQNLGVARSIISGVSAICADYGRAIVVEDDLVVSPYLLRYMNDALAMYETEERVASIGAYMFPVSTALPETFFLRIPDCWGWAVWRRGWELFESNGARLLHEIERRKLTRDFDFNYSYPYTQMLKDQIQGKNDSWAIRWYASTFLADRLTLYPGRSMTANAGNDGSGRHLGKTEVYDGAIASHPVNIRSIPVEENGFTRREIERFFRRTQRGLTMRVADRLRNMFSAIGK